MTGIPTNLSNFNVEGLSEGELRELFIKWFGKAHPDKRNPKINSIKRDKIYFIWDGSTDESMIHTKYIQDLFDRGKI